MFEKCPHCRKFINLPKFVEVINSTSESMAVLIYPNGWRQGLHDLPQGDMADHLRDWMQAWIEQALKEDC